MMKTRFRILIFLTISQVAFAGPFRISSFVADGFIPEKLHSNMTSETGANYVRFTSEPLLAKLKKEADEDSWEAHFDIGVIYFLGVGISRNNQTAVDHFLKSYELNPNFRAALLNAEQIKFGPIRDKNVGDLTESLGRMAHGKIIQLRDYLLYFQSFFNRS